MAGKPLRGGGRKGLNRGRVLDAAVALVDRSGADALTMRRLAGDLGVEAMSLYAHVRDKEALLDGVSERVMDEVPFVEREGDFDAWVRAQLEAFRSALLRHPGALTVVATRPVMSEHTVAIAESVLGELTEEGFPPEEANRLLWVFVAFVTGHCLNQLAGMARAAEGRTLVDLWATSGSIDPDAHPTVASTFGAERWSRASEQAEFDLGVDLLLAGLRARRPRRRQGAGRSSRSTPQLSSTKSPTGEPA